ncbi:MULTISPECIES: LysR substrate-binding domain-containing protein [unclassified Bradyrhizobium]|uniref:LysR substrate-binding domain-containing protein n=1 Tax=unclassified Bradyrhizobium TaxID=2631580 RepID=UPI00247AD403|nr:MULTISPECIES: LysR substrate-binding domain-containing protein [unclassified Bradyrhizobium]WGS24092.1 LysR substrate-binding domain-containing protein [Bradyrhizobium sp. ISRA463]WGS31401.1 LysR substrate-binding domain-containing protein [Bradyrhizobium sp. ISRA464]
MNEIHHLPQSDLPLRAVPPLPALFAFERAAAQLSFRRAAYDLALTPSAVSHQIRNLEAQLGVKLFIRDGRSVRLTSEGESFRRQISTALSTLERASRAVSSGSRMQPNELRISSLPFFTSTILIPALPDFAKANPGVALRIEATHQYADFSESVVDLAVRYGRENSTGLRLEPLLKVRLVPVCAPQLVKVGLRAPSDLSNQTLINLIRQPRAWQSWLTRAGLKDLSPVGKLWLDSVPLALEAAESGVGVALAMDPLIRARPGFGKRLVVPFDPGPGQSETLYLVSRSEQVQNRRLTSVRRWIKNAVRTAVGL